MDDLDKERAKNMATNKNSKNSTRFPVIVYCLDDGFLDCTLVSAFTALKWSPREIQLHLFHDQLTSKNRLRLEKFSAAFADRVKVFPVKQQLPKVSGSHITNFALARLTVIPEYRSRVLYLDGDTLIRQDITELLRLPLHGDVIGAAICPTHLSWWYKSKNRWRPGHQRNKNIVNQRLKQLDTDTLNNYINSGVMLVDAGELHRLKLATKFADLNHAAQMRWHDQDHINAALKEHIRIIDSKYNSIWGNLTLRNSVIPQIIRRAHYAAMTDPVIVHFAGKQKPWLNNKQRIGMRLRRLTTHRKEIQYIREWKAARAKLESILDELRF